MRQGIYSAPKYLNNYAAPTNKKWPQDIQCIIKSNNPQRGSLYLSNVQAAQNPVTVKRLRIGAILTCAKGYQLSHPKHLVPFYKYIAGQDKQTFDISIHFDQAVQFIQQTLQKTNIIVHCIAGVSRSVSMVIAYFMKNKNMTYNQAYYQVKSKRKIISPNDGFIKHLKDYQKKLDRQRNYMKRSYANNSSFYEQQNQNDQMNVYKSQLGTFYTPKKTLQYYRNIDSKHTKNPQMPLKDSIINIKPSIYQSSVNNLYSSSPRRNVENIKDYNKFSKSMNMIPIQNNSVTDKKSQSYYTIKLNSSKELSNKKFNNYMTENNKNNMSTTLNRQEVLYESQNTTNKNGYFDSMNTELNEKIEAIRKKYEQQRQQMLKNYGNRGNKQTTPKNLYVHNDIPLKRASIVNERPILRTPTNNFRTNQRFDNSYSYMNTQTLNRNYENRANKLDQPYVSRYNTGYGSIYGSYPRRYY